MFQVGLEIVDLDHQEPELPASALEVPVSRVTLHLAPVGARFSIRSDAQLRSLVSSLLSTLQAVHQAGLVHRDIREDNAVRYFDRWVLIDWELAGRADEQVWWHGKSLPPAVEAGNAYICQHDLWQVGKLIHRCAVASRAAGDFARLLMEGFFASADIAMQSIWAPS